MPVGSRPDSRPLVCRALEGALRTSVLRHLVVVAPPDGDGVAQVRSALQDVPTGDVPVQILQNPDHAAARRTGSVRRHRHPVHVGVNAQRPREISHHHDSPVENPDEEKVSPLVGLVDLGCEFRNAVADLFLGQ